MIDSKFLDRVIAEVDVAVRSIAGATRATRPSPAVGLAGALEAIERDRSIRLMRVNHVGEVCAQALYQAQALATRDASLREHFRRSAVEERDHLGWTADRLADLGGRPSRLNALWYAGAFGLGAIAGVLGDRVSLGFVEETERQVEHHLESHLERLPMNDSASRAIVEQMKHDESQHAEQAKERGAAMLPTPVQWIMRAMAKVMTTTAARI